MTLRKFWISNSIVILFLSLLVLKLNAQQTFSFIRISEEYVQGRDSNYIIASLGQVTNMTQSNMLITLRKTAQNMPPQWNFCICSWYGCYAQGVDSVTEICPPGQNLMGLYFYPYYTSGTGTITITAKKFTNPSENYSVTFGAIANPIGIIKISEVAKDFNLSQNYPNPFNPTTKIGFSIPKKDYVDLRIYDILGREVKTLVSQPMEAGEYEVEFEALNMSSGFYYYRLKTGEYVSVKKMVLVK